MFIAVQDSQGETVRSFRNEDALFGREAVDTRVRNMGDMLYVPRIATSFDLQRNRPFYWVHRQPLGQIRQGRMKIL